MQPGKPASLTSTAKLSRAAAALRASAGTTWAALPVLLCLALYWPGLTAWFQRDDFAWLNLAWEVKHGFPLVQGLFAPMTEGTVRVLSERAYFIVLYRAFGLHALPFHLVVFATEIANIFLLVSLALRLTRSRVAAVCAASLWVANHAIATPLTWLSAFNQVLCAFFVLAALRMLIAYLDTGKVRWYVLQWIAFIAGFGASEFIVVYPAAAMLVVFTVYRRLPLSVAALWAPSLAFGVQHLLVMKPPAQGPYAFAIDRRILTTLGTYWRWTLGPGSLEYMGYLSARATNWLTVGLSLPLLAFAFLEAKRREFLPAVLLVWFPLWLAAVLPLPYHITDYYPVIGAIGVSILGGSMVACAWRAGRGWALLAIVLVGVYAGTSAFAARETSAWYHEQSARAKRLVLGVARTKAQYPGRTVVVSGVDGPLFWAGVFDNSFRLLGGPPVYLSEDTPDWVLERPELGNIVDRFELPAAATEQGLFEQRVVVYDAASDKVTATRLDRIGAHGPLHTILPGNELYSSQLGGGWFPAEGTHRWMGKRASLTLARPATAQQKLNVSGQVPRFLVANGPVRLAVYADGREIGKADLTQGDAGFALVFPLPAELIGTGTMTVTLEVGRTQRPPGGDRRDLGLAISTVSVR